MIKLFTKRALAQFTGISRPTIDQWIDSGMLHASYQDHRSKPLFTVEQARQLQHAKKQDPYRPGSALTAV